MLTRGAACARSRIDRLQRVVPGTAPPWRSALHPIEPELSDEDWHSLGSLGDGFSLEVQRTGAGDQPRWHVDIETDDVPAEVARLEALGAVRIADMGGFWQMEDPAGLLFCVVGIQTGAAFERYATTWP